MRVFGTWYGKKSRNHSLLVFSSVHVANGSPPSPWTATMLWYILEMAMQRKWQKTYSATAVSVSFRIKSPVFSFGAHLAVVGIFLGGSAPPPPLDTGIGIPDVCLEGSAPLSSLGAGIGICPEGSAPLFSLDMGIGIPGACPESSAPLSSLGAGIGIPGVCPEGSAPLPSLEAGISTPGTRPGGSVPLLPSLEAGVDAPGIRPGGSGLLLRRRLRRRLLLHLKHPTILN